MKPILGGRLLKQRKTKKTDPSNALSVSNVSKKQKRILLKRQLQLDKITKRISEMERKVEEMKDCVPNACIICRTNQSSIVIIPCGHVSLCVECTDLFFGAHQSCPVCRTQVEMFLRVYYS